MLKDLHGVGVGGEGWVRRPRGGTPILSPSHPRDLGTHHSPSCGASPESRMQRRGNIYGACLLSLLLWSWLPDDQTEAQGKEGCSLRPHKHSADTRLNRASLKNRNRNECLVYVIKTTVNPSY